MSTMPKNSPPKHLTTTSEAAAPLRETEATEAEVLVATFYRFTRIERVAEMKARVEALGKKHKILGTVLLASEGVNSTICGEPERLAQWEREFCELIPGFADMSFRHTKAQHAPFRRWRVKIRPEIVTLGVEGIDPTSCTGEHVPPDEWNKLIRREDVRVIDTRNHYEYKLGSFARAEDPLTDNFREFPAWVDENLNPKQDEHVAMFCTGGIRCEKATAYLLQQGFKHVYQLDGGILEYLRQQDADTSLWHGECFIFDDRVSLDHAMQPTGREVCCACRKPFDLDSDSEAEQEGICPSCLSQLSERQLAGVRERMRQVRLSQQRGNLHLAPQAATGTPVIDTKS